MPRGSPPRQSHDKVDLSTELYSLNLIARLLCCTALNMTKK